MSVRTDKVANLIKEEISLIFLQKLNDPEFGLVTITSVKLSPDLKYSKIYISIYDKEKRTRLLEKLNEIKGFVRSQLAGRLKIRYTPELNFFIDDTLDYVEKMENLFKDIRNNDNKKNKESE